MAGPCIKDLLCYNGSTEVYRMVRRILRLKEYKMKKIYKHVVKVTILSENESLENSFKAFLRVLGQEWGLSDVQYAITDDDCIGAVNHESSDEIPLREIKKELVAIGKNKTFFDYLESGECLN